MFAWLVHWSFLSGWTGGNLWCFWVAYSSRFMQPQTLHNYMPNTIRSIKQAVAEKQKYLSFCAGAEDRRRKFKKSMIAQSTDKPPGQDQGCLTFAITAKIIRLLQATCMLQPFLQIITQGLCCKLRDGAKALELIRQRVLDREGRCNYWSSTSHMTMRPIWSKNGLIPK